MWKRIERDFHADGISDETETTTYAYNNRGLRTALDTWLVTPYSALVKASVMPTAYDAEGNALTELTATFNDFDSDVDRVSLVVFSYAQNGLVLNAQCVRRGWADD